MLKTEQNKEIKSFKLQKKGIIKKSCTSPFHSLMMVKQMLLQIGQNRIRICKTNISQWHQTIFYTMFHKMSHHKFDTLF